MTDTINNKKIQVVTGGAWPFIRVSLDFLDRLRPLLDDNGLKYWVGHQAISIDGQPAFVTVHFNRKIDPHQVQDVLDNAA